MKEFIRRWDSNRTKFLVQASAIAALYAVLTIIFFSTSYGPIQIRFSEALTVLPAFTPAAVPGLFVGCLIANLIKGEIVDVVIGSLTTLLAAYWSYRIKKPYLVPLPPVLLNGIIIGPMVYWLYGAPSIFQGNEAPAFLLLMTVLFVTLGQAIACYGLGYPLMLTLKKYEWKIFK